jgi:hypothetical protein
VGLDERPRGSTWPTSKVHYNSLPRTSIEGALGPFGSDSDLRRHGGKIASRGGKNSKKRAVVAVARKLAVLLHSLWMSAEVYEPLRNAHRSGAGRRQLRETMQRNAANGRRGGDPGTAATTLKRRTRGYASRLLAEIALRISGTRRLRKRTRSTLEHEERPLGRLQRLLSSPNQDGSHPMHRATMELAHRECG